MAQKNIVVVDGEQRFVLNPRAKDEGERVTLSAKASAAVRKHVQAYVENDPRDLPYHDLLKANKRVGLMPGNHMVEGIRFITGIGAEEVVEPEQELVAGQPEAPAKEQAPSKPKKQMTAARKKMLLAEMRQYDDQSIAEFWNEL